MIKKLIITILLTLGALHSKADQYQIVSEDDAIVAVEILNSQPDVFLWCDCCDGSYINYIQVQSASYEYAYGEGNDCYVFLSGYDEYGDWFEEPIDLAYTYIADGDWATRLSNFIGLEAEPCYDEPIRYYDDNPFSGGGTYNEEDEYSYGDNEYYNDGEELNDLMMEEVNLVAINCDIYCYLSFFNGEDELLSAVVFDPSEFPDFFFDSEYGYYLNPDFENVNALVTYKYMDIELEDGSYGSEMVLAGITTNE
jgi:hypothetical protein